MIKPYIFVSFLCAYTVSYTSEPFSSTAYNSCDQHIRTITDQQTHYKWDAIGVGILLLAGSVVIVKHIFDTNKKTVQTPKSLPPVQEKSNNVINLYAPYTSITYDQYSNPILSKK